MTNLIDAVRGMESSPTSFKRQHVVIETSALTPRSIFYATYSYYILGVCFLTWSSSKLFQVRDEQPRRASLVFFS